MATIRDVAKQSGVSIATVSHVLNNRSSKVGPDTRERVLAAVRELRYRPTALEDRQKATQTNNLAFLVPEMGSSPITANQYLGHVLDGVIEAAALRGYSTTITVEQMWDDVGHAIRRSYDGHCDGAIMLAPGPSSEALKTLWERGTPLVLVGTSTNLSGVSTVDIDNEATGRNAVRHLSDLGHRKIAYVASDPLSTAAQERCRGYLRAMAAIDARAEDVCAAFAWSASIPGQDLPSVRERLGPTVPYIERVFDLIGSETDLVRLLLTKGMPEATAVFTYNDGTGRRIVQALEARGVSVPGDIALVSVDDALDSVNAHPYLTTYRQPMHQIGKKAVAVLMDRIEDPTRPDQTVKFIPELLVRETSVPPRAKR